MNVFPCVVDNRNIFWVTSKIIASSGDVGLSLLLPSPPPIQSWNLLRACLPATTPGCAAPYGNSWLRFSSVLCSSVTERLTTEHEVVGSNHRQTDGFKSEEKNWKKLKLWSVSCVVCGLGRWMEDRCQTSISSILDTCVHNVDRSAWIRASENTLKCMVKTASHVLNLA